MKIGLIEVQEVEGDPSLLNVAHQEYGAATFARDTVERTLSALLHRPRGDVQRDSFRREIRWEVGYDHRHDDDLEKRKYGCHGLNMRWLLHGPDATVQFLLYTGWLPTWKEFRFPDEGQLGPLPADLGYHADAQQYESQESRECDCRPSKRCFYDGSGLMANDVFALLVSSGEEAVWKKMREMYDDLKRQDNSERPHSEEK